MPPETASLIRASAALNPSAGALMVARALRDRIGFVGDLARPHAEAAVAMLRDLAVVVRKRDEEIAELRARIEGRPIVAEAVCDSPRNDFEAALDEGVNVVAIDAFDVLDAFEAMDREDESVLPGVLVIDAEVA